MKSWTLIFGSTSGIAEAFARLEAGSGANLILVARNGDRLVQQKKDLEIRGASEVEVRSLDFLKFSSHPAFVQELFHQYHIDRVLMAQGCMFDQSLAENDFSKVKQSIEVNFMSVASLGNALIPAFEKQAAGQLAVISSVAGDRGRRSNFIYGSTKAAVQAYVSGLRGRLFASGVNVIDIRPGFVATAMTAHLKKGPLVAQADQVARGIQKAFRCRSVIVYLPGFWRMIMFVIRNLPDAVFKRLKF